MLRLVVALALLYWIVLVAACDGDDEATTATPGETATAVTPTVPVAESPTPTETVATPVARCQAQPNEKSGSIIRVQGDPWCIAWEDRWDNELGFRVVVHYSGGGRFEAFVYDTGPGETEVVPPASEAPGDLRQTLERKDFAINLYVLLPDGPRLADAMGVTRDCFDCPPPPTATPRPAEACPAPDATLCDFATHLENLANAGDWQALVDLSDTVSVPCTGDREPPSPGYHVCEGLEPGDVGEGYPVGHLHSDAGIIRVEDLLPHYQQLSTNLRPQAIDPIADGTFHVLSIGEGPPIDNVPDCDGCWSVVLSVINASGSDQTLLERRQYIFVVAPTESGWRIKKMIWGILIDYFGGDDVNDEMSAALRGGTLYDTVLEPWSPDGAVDREAPFWFGAPAAAEGTGNCLPVRSEVAPHATALACVPDGEWMTIIGGGGPIAATAQWLVSARDDEGRIVQGWVNGAFIGAP